MSGIKEISTAIANGETSALEQVEAALKKAEELKEYNALISINEQAVEQAKAIDARIAAGELTGPLAGVPYIAKDNFLTKGNVSTAASNILGNFEAPFNATAINRLEEAGAILVAKGNHDSFGHGSSNENSDFGPALNPHDKTRVPGGSSGGVAAAVKLGIVPFGVATDTGGSIRQPASLTGTVGLKPTYGLVSRYGVAAMASSTDTIGPIANTVEDVGLVMDVISGRDVLDSTTIERDQASYADLDDDVSGKTIGVIEEYLGDGVDEGVKGVVEAAITQLELAGATIKRLSIPNIDQALAAYYIVMPAEVSSNLSRYDGIRYGLSEGGSDLEGVYLNSRSKGFNSEAKRRILIGTYVLSSGYYDAYYKKAQKVRTLLIEQFNQAFEGVDFLVGPVSPTAAFKLGENVEDPLKMYLADIMTVSSSLVGCSAISVPYGDNPEGLPVGLQVIAPQRHDRALLGFAAGAEKTFVGASS